MGSFLKVVLSNYIDARQLMTNTPVFPTPQEIAGAVVQALNDASHALGFWLDAAHLAWASWLGLLITSAGTLFSFIAFKQAQGAKTAAQQARQAAQETAKELRKQIVIADLSAAGVEVSEIKSYLEIPNVVAAQAVFRHFQSRILKCLSSDALIGTQDKATLNKGLRTIANQLGKGPGDPTYKKSIAIKALNGLQSWLLESEAEIVQSLAKEDSDAENNS